MECQSHPSPMKLHQKILADPLKSPSRGRGTIGLVGKDDDQLRDTPLTRIDVYLMANLNSSDSEWNSLSSLDRFLLPRICNGLQVEQLVLSLEHNVPTTIVKPFNFIHYTAISAGVSVAGKFLQQAVILAHFLQKIFLPTKPCLGTLQDHGHAFFALNPREKYFPWKTCTSSYMWDVLCLCETT